MSSTTADGQTIPMSTIRAWWENEQRRFLERWAETHEFDFCPLHGFWKLGPKRGGLHVLTCPGCPSPEAVERLTGSDGKHDGTDD